MKYLPKSKLGAAIAGAYLTLVFLILVLMRISSDGNVHNPGPVLLFYLLLIITLPLSWLAVSDSITNEYLGMGVAVCAVIVNAGVIYLIVGFVSRVLQSCIRRLKRLK